MKVSTVDLLLVFDNLLSVTNEDLGEYWFTSTLCDDYIVTLVISLYENTASVLLERNEVSLTRLNLIDCKEIKVLNIEKKYLEITHGNNKGRCQLFLSPQGIIDYTNN